MCIKTAEKYRNIIHSVYTAKSDLFIYETACKMYFAVHIIYMCHFKIHFVYKKCFRHKCKGMQLLNKKKVEI